MAGEVFVNKINVSAGDHLRILSRKEFEAIPCSLKFDEENTAHVASNHDGVVPAGTLVNLGGKPIGTWDSSTNKFKAPYSGGLAGILLYDVKVDYPIGAVLTKGYVNYDMISDVLKNDHEDAGEATSELLETVILETVNLPT